MPDIMTDEERREQRLRSRSSLSRKETGILLFFFAICSLISAISGTVKYYTSVEDYHYLTSKNVRYGNLVNGEIDKWYGPFAGYDDGRELYLLEVDNGQFIPYITNDENQNKDFKAYNENSEEAIKIDMSGKIEGINEEVKGALLKTFEEQGFNIQQAEEKLILYTIVNYKDPMIKYEYMAAIILASFGFFKFYPEFNDFVGRAVSRKSRREALENRATRHYSSPNQYTAPGQKRD